MNQASDNPWWNRNWLLGLSLVAATILAYQPAWHAGFIWDDNDYVTHNPLLAAPDGLHRIWFSTDAPSQYFPLVYTTFRLEHALWGLNPAGYHWVNILLHAVNALLAWRLLRRLAVPGAWFAAAIFALHPVNVESVAWVTQLKNVQSLFFILLTLLAWVEFLEEPPRWRWYAVALLTCALALFSKTTACTLPAALLAILWLERKPIGWARLAQITPFVMFGVAMGFVSMWWERHHQGTEGAAYSIGLLERVLVASRAVWFYAGKLLWPANLIFNYPLWKIDPTDPLAYGWLVAGTGVGAAIYFARRFVGRSMEVAAVYYVATLSPLLGLIMLYTFRYTFVCDHYQYVATLGPIALLAAAVGSVAWLRNAWLKPALGGVLLAVLAVLTWRQCRMYTDLETLWRTTSERNPSSFMAHNNLGAISLQQGNLEEAAAHFQKALEVEPNSPNAHFNLGQIFLHDGRLGEAAAHFRKVLEMQPGDAKTHGDLGAILLRTGQVEESVAHCQTALKIQPNLVEAEYNLAVGLFQLGRIDDAIPHFQNVAAVQPGNAEVQNNLGWCLLQSGRVSDAIAQFQTVLKIQPDFAQAQANLALAFLRDGQAREAVACYRSFLRLQPDAVPVLSTLAWLLATHPEATIRNGAQAIELAERANRISGGQEPAVLRTLAAAYAEAGQFPEAVTTAKRAMELAESRADPAFSDTIRLELKAYQDSAPFREIGTTGAPTSSNQP